ncbi:non-ribosomal peptide synthetase [Amycolatopsis sp. WQ 127309]|uniref:non-ribosomal peptide synthetase n=1 Tax=Amycolatopsis sp. WQ 127309 TaxID=2932773 RepID=UPI001FF31F43|nr:non-ribosomal peptide synthetase [Amycolatopsis sp. WQ 127309]UOZ04409.1 non-ribosomal peptide synthetase [Amycolatopsis sp. WQ 127309]
MTERIFFSERFLLATPPAAPMCIQVVVEGTGSLVPAALADAVGRAARTCHGSRLTRRGGRWLDSGRAPAVRTLDGDRVDRVTFAGEPALERPLTGAGGAPMSEVVLLTGARPAVVFRVHHSLMDGKGALLWAGEVFRALRGEVPTGPDARTTMRDVQHLLGPRPGPGPAKPTAPPPLRGRAPLAARGHFFRRRTVDGRHPAAVAKIATALTELCGLDPATFIVPVDLRRHLPGGFSTGPLTSQLTLPVPPGSTWQRTQETLLRLVGDGRHLTGYPHPALLWLLDRVPLPAWRALLSTVDTAMAVKGKPGPAFTVSHLGLVDLADYTAGGFTATTVCSLPVCGLLITPVLTIVEVDGRTEIIISGDDVDGLADRAEALLDGIAAVLSPPEAQLRGTVTPAVDETLVSLFARQVARTPGAVAVVEGDTTLTYAELAARSDAVAHTLVERGVRPGDLVGLLAERTAATLAGLWGVLKAGAAYLPLDPNHPDAWLADLLADAGAAACLLPASHAHRPCTPDGCTRITPDNRRAAFPGVPVAPEDLAYVIYTSGSTGRPKGVEVEHRHVVNYVRWAIREYRIGAATRFPLFTSLAFDLPVTAILLPLLAGGSVAVFAEEPNHVGLTRMLRDSGVDSVKLTPSHLELIARLGITAPGVRLAIVGGERLAVRTAAAARAAFGPDCRVINEYGPTEVTVGCVVHEYDPATDVGAAVPIGRPADNVTVHLLDDRRAAVPAGEVGAIHLSGAQTVRGYRGRPDLTERLFVRLADGSRAYATGDHARVLPSGALDYLGRGDDQIKVLGHRVEPAEIEHALETHPAISRAAVVARSRPGDTDRVPCAYVVCAGDVLPADLTAHLAARVPKHLVPSVFVAVPDLPLAPSGKVDAHALPDPFATADVPTAEPAGPTESALAAIWATTLGLPERDIGPDSDFYSLGGTSLTLMVMVAKVCAEVVAPEDEPRFMAALGEIIDSPTLRRVAHLAASPVRVPIA